MKCHTLPINGGQLSYQTFGETGKPLLVLHGGPGLGYNYLLPQMSELGKTAFTIFYDQRGTGNSISTNDWQEDPFTTYCEDIENLRQALGLKKMSLLAHSFGGVFAAFYALAYPENVDKIIYVNSTPLSSEDYFHFVKHRRSIVEKNKAALDTLRESLHDDPEIFKQYYRLYFKNYFAKPELADTLTLDMTKEAVINNFRIYDFFFSYMQNHPFNLYEKLYTLNKPSLIIAGDKDVIPLSYMEKLHANLQASTYKVIKNCGHFSYIDQPEILFDEIKLFCS